MYKDNLRQSVVTITWCKEKDTFKGYPGRNVKVLFLLFQQGIEKKSQIKFRFLKPKWSHFNIDTNVSLGTEDSGLRWDNAEIQYIQEGESRCKGIVGSQRRNKMKCWKKYGKDKKLRTIIIIYQTFNEHLNSCGRVAISTQCTYLQDAFSQDRY